ncbi:hypothetical protein GLYMA_08G362600v4 [Glycine max]|nr:hypothetical protein GLYMA_08G362600v4 [Glycine max]KAH1054781.1 hypothetical protein GYH30_023515 [Glycine max]
MAYEITEIKKIGIGLIGFGIFFAFLGIILFFDRGLLALGNIFSLAGVAILLGWRSTWALFTYRANFKGSASFLLGLFFICVRWPIVVDFGHLSKCSSIISLLLDGLYSLSLLLDCHRRDLTDALVYG